MSKPIRILIADAQPLVRAGLRSLLEREPGFAVVSESSSRAEMITQANTLTPDVILLELAMPPLGSMTAITSLKQHHPYIRILVLTAFPRDALAFKAIRAGAASCLDKTVTVDLLTQAIRTVYQDENTLRFDIANRMKRALAQITTSSPLLQRLTRREIETLYLLAHGLSHRDIAQVLGISKGTVPGYVTRVFNKLKLAGRRQAAHYARKAGLVDSKDMVHA